jgi:hypothetical protein
MVPFVAIVSFFFFFFSPCVGLVIACFNLFVYQPRSENLQVLA